MNEFWLTFNFQPNSHPYESVTVFVPSERAELVDLLTSEDVLLDLTQPLYLNFTHEAIVNRFEHRYEAHDKITGDVYVCDNPPEDADTDGSVFYNRNAWIPRVSAPLDDFLLEIRS